MRESVKTNIGNIGYLFLVVFVAMGIFSSCKDRNKEGLYTETQWYENGQKETEGIFKAVSYTHLRAHET